MKVCCSYVTPFFDLKILCPQLITTYVNPLLYLKRLNPLEIDFQDILMVLEMLLSKAL